jgi:hypothetical protein
MPFELFSRAALAEDLPDYTLQKGDLVTIVEYLPENEHHKEGYVVEIFDVLGNTLHVLSVYATQLQALKARAVPFMREVG